MHLLLHTSELKRQGTPASPPPKRKQRIRAGESSGKTFDTILALYPPRLAQALQPAPHLLHVDAASEQVRGDEHAAGSGAELTHDDVACVLVHVAVRGAHSVVALAHLLGQPVHLGGSGEGSNGSGEARCGVRLGLLAIAHLLLANAHSQCMRKAGKIVQQPKSCGR
jgi:hypothetical protein